MYKISQINSKTIKISNLNNFSLKDTFLCGQCFRFDCDENGIWHGTVKDKEISLYEDDCEIYLLGVSIEEFNSFWKNYFDFDRDYDKIIKELSKDPILKEASAFGSGIRILKQEPFEALCSFIISQNNNIPRIKGIIKRLCENFGEKLTYSYSFPTAEKIASLSLEDLSVLRSGFRAKYILDCAKRVSNGDIDLNLLKTADTDFARQQLMTIYGVGEKVADCTLLFGLNHLNAFPKDVWIKRALEVLYGGDFPHFALPYAGIAQQYLFYYARETKLQL